jgi:hypothetical protein
LLPAGAFAGWGLHPLESAALSRRTPIADSESRGATANVCWQARRRARDYPARRRVRNARSVSWSLRQEVENGGSEGSRIVQRSIMVDVPENDSLCLRYARGDRVIDQAEIRRRPLPFQDERPLIVARSLKRERGWLRAPFGGNAVCLV